MQAAICKQTRCKQNANGLRIGRFEILTNPADGSGISISQAAQLSACQPQPVVHTITLCFTAFSGTVIAVRRCEATWRVGVSIQLEMRTGKMIAAQSNLDGAKLHGGKLHGGKLHATKLHGGSQTTNRSLQQLVGRVHSFFRRHPEISRNEFLLDAVKNELGLLEKQETCQAVVSRTSPQARRLPQNNQVPDEQFVNRVAAVTERLARLHDQRYGLWPQVRRFFFG